MTRDGSPSAKAMGACLCLLAIYSMSNGIALGQSADTAAGARLSAILR
jgi:hypothetical protein